MVTENEQAELTVNGEKGATGRNTEEKDNKEKKGEGAGVRKRKKRRIRIKVLHPGRILGIRVVYPR